MESTNTGEQKHKMFNFAIFWPALHVALWQKAFDFNFIQTFVNESHLLCDMNKTEYTYLKENCKKKYSGRKENEKEKQPSLCFIQPL